MIPKVIESSMSQISKICKTYHIRELSLFGSRARGDNSKHSDFDFLVEFKPDAKTSLFDLYAIQSQLEDVVKEKVDLVPKLGLKSSIREGILNQTIKIYPQ